MADLGSLTVRIDANTASLSSGVAKAQSQLATLNGKVRSMGAGMSSLGKGLSLAVTAPLLMIGKMGLDELKDIQAANAQTAAAIQRVGANSLMSVRGVRALAGALQQKSGIDDQAIQSGMNYLMTLGSVDTTTAAGAAMVNRAARSMTEFADSMGMDAATAGRLYAKSLAAASEGTVALPRGVKLGGAALNKLKEQFKHTSNATTRQTLLLNALSAKFKGGMRLTDAERWELMKEKIAGLSATLLTKAIPTFRKIVDFVGKMADKFGQLSPRVQGMIGKGALLAGVLGPVLVVVGSLATAIAAIGLPVIAVAAGIGVVVTAFTVFYKRSEKVRQITHTVIGLIKKYKLVILAIVFPVGAYVAVMVKAYQKSEKFRNVVQFVIAAIRLYISMLVKFWTTIVKFIAGVAQAIVKSQTFRAVVGLVTTVLRGVWSVLRLVASVLATVASKIWDVTEPLRGALKTALEWIRDKGGSVFTAISGAASALDGIIAGVIDTVTTLIGKLESAWDWAQKVAGADMSGSGNANPEDFGKSRNRNRGGVDMGKGIFGLSGAMSSMHGSAIATRLADVDTATTKRRAYLAKLIAAQEKLAKAREDGTAKQIKAAKAAFLAERKRLGLSEKGALASIKALKQQEKLAERLAQRIAALAAELAKINTRADLQIAITRWQEAIGTAGPGQMLGVLRKQYQELLAYLQTNAGNLSAQDRAALYNQMADILGQIRDLENPAGETDTDTGSGDDDTTTVPTGEFDPGVFSRSRRGGTAGPTIHIGSLTINATNAAGGKAAARVFMRELEMGYMSRAIVGGKRRAG